MRGRPVRILGEMAEILIRYNVTRGAAALSYYLTLTVFPFLVCVSAILGSLQLLESDMFLLLEDIIPTASFQAITDFLRYVSGNSSTILLVVGLIAMVTSSSAAFRSFTGIMNEIQGKSRYTGIWKGIISFIFSIVFLASIYLSALVILSGGWLMQILEEYLGFGELLALWTWFRFVILFLLLLGIIFGVYYISTPKGTRRRDGLPGAFTASVVLVIMSIIFSKMISVSLRYQILYGSLASFVILMVWLYICGIILIMGNVFNISLKKTGRYSK